MQAGVRGAHAYVLVLSDEVLTRPAVRLELSVALDRDVPIVSVLVPSTPATKVLLQQGQQQQKEALAEAGAFAAARSLVRELTGPQWAALETRLPARQVPFHRDVDLLWAETVPSLFRALGLDEAFAARPAPPTQAEAPFCAPRPLNLLIAASSPLGDSQATYLELALPRRCAGLKASRLQARCTAAGAAAAASSVEAVLIVLTERVFDNEAVCAAARAAAFCATCMMWAICAACPDPSGTLTLTQLARAWPSPRAWCECAAA